MSSDPCALDPSSPTGSQNVHTVHVWCGCVPVSRVPAVHDAMFALEQPGDLMSNCLLGLTMMGCASSSSCSG